MSLRTSLLVLLGSAALIAAMPSIAYGQSSSDSTSEESALGRWDIQVEDPDGTYPSWLEITRRDGALQGRFVGRFGGARRVDELSVDGSQVRFALPPQFESREQPLEFEGEWSGDTMSGETRNDHGELVQWSAHRAPKLKSGRRVRWGHEAALLAASSLQGWHARGGGDKTCWELNDGTLASTGECSDLVTVRRYDDFKLHLEFMVPPGSDSGVHLRGRYEIQLADDTGGAEERDSTALTGGLYGFLPPLRPAARPAGEWQSLDVTLIGRTLTVVLNGETVVDAQEIPGITGDALDSDEGAPGPIVLQGGLGPVSFRNIVITPALHEL